MRCHAFSRDSLISSEWNRCQSSMAQRTRDRVAPLRRSSAAFALTKIVASIIETLTDF